MSGISDPRRYPHHPPPPTARYADESEYQRVLSTSTDDYNKFYEGQRLAHTAAFNLQYRCEVFLKKIKELEKEKAELKRQVEEKKVELEQKQQDLETISQEYSELSDMNANHSDIVDLAEQVIGDSFSKEVVSEYFQQKRQLIEKNRKTVAKAIAETTSSSQLESCKRPTSPDHEVADLPSPDLSSSSLSHQSSDLDIIDLSGSELMSSETVLQRAVEDTSSSSSSSSSNKIIIKVGRAASSSKRVRPST